MVTREVLLPVSFALMARPGTGLHAGTPGGDPPARRGPVPALARDGAAGRGRRACAVDRGRGGRARRRQRARTTPRSPRRSRREHYRLEVLASDVEDNPDAVTRFVLVSRPGEPPLPTGHDKTSLVAFISDDHPGALLEVLTELVGARGQPDPDRVAADRRGLGRYCFSIDCEGHVDDARVGEALSGLRRVCPDVRFLGSYPRADRGAAAEAAAARRRREGRGLPGRRRLARPDPQRPGLTQRSLQPVASPRGR